MASYDVASNSIALAISARPYLQNGLGKERKRASRVIHEQHVTRSNPAHDVARLPPGGYAGVRYQHRANERQARDVAELAQENVGYICREGRRGEQCESQGYDRRVRSERGRDDCRGWDAPALTALAGRRRHDACADVTRGAEMCRNKKRGLNIRV
jgi:hypothetical protein